VPTARAPIGLNGGGPFMRTSLRWRPSAHVLHAALSLSHSKTCHIIRPTSTVLWRNWPVAVSLSVFPIFKARSDDIGVLRLPSISARWRRVRDSSAFEWVVNFFTICSKFFIIIVFVTRRTRSITDNHFSAEAQVSDWRQTTR